MKILVIEDSVEKRKKLTSYCEKKYPDLIVVEAKSYNSGINAMNQGDYAFILLDMSMPTFDNQSGESGGRMRALAGREIISKMGRRNVIIPVVVVTRFDVFGQEGKKITREELDVELKQKYPLIYMGSVFFDSTSNSWVKNLDSILQRLHTR